MLRGVAAVDNLSTTPSGDRLPTRRMTPGVVRRISEPMSDGSIWTDARCPMRIGEPLCPAICAGSFATPPAPPSPPPPPPPPPPPAPSSPSASSTAASKSGRVASACTSWQNRSASRWSANWSSQRRTWVGGNSEATREACVEAAWPLHERPIGSREGRFGARSEERPWPEEERRAPRHVRKRLGGDSSDSEAHAVGATPRAPLGGEPHHRRDGAVAVGHLGEQPDRVDVRDRDGALPAEDERLEHDPAPEHVEDHLRRGGGGCNHGAGGGVGG